MNDNEQKSVPDETELIKNMFRDIKIRLGKKKKNTLSTETQLNRLEVVSSFFQTSLRLDLVLYGYKNTKLTTLP